MTERSVERLDPAQARELVRLTDREARWENLPRATPFDGPGAAVADLRERQRAYDEFTAALAGYNRRFRPGYASEVQLNTPLRLGLWCRAVRCLLARVEHDPEVRFPDELVAKAYRLAARIAGRVNKDLVHPTEPPTSTRAAVEALDGLVRWCDEVAADAPVRSTAVAAI